MTVPSMTREGRVRVAQAWAVVPVHDEAARLERCLASLDRAVATARTAGLPAGVVVVLDACTDTSDRVCAGWPVARVVTGAWRRVGAARAAGCAEALRQAAASGVAPQAVWLACTDADGAVPFDWITHHARLADRGADALRGTVSVDDWSHWPAGVEAAYRTAYRSDERHPHVHGANLGVRGSAYLAAGGFADVGTDEDVRLVRALVDRGARVVASGHAAVRTSARPVGRAPGGFSGHLRTLAAREPAARVLAPADGA